MNQSDTVEIIYPALIKLQHSVKKIEKSETAQRGEDFWSFAPLPVINEVLRPTLKRLELGVMQDTKGDGISQAGAKTRIIHTSGEWVESDWLMIPNIHDADEAGSAVTRCRRWSLLGLLNISPVDTDGHPPAQIATPSLEDEYRSLINQAKKNKTIDTFLERLGPGYTNIARAIEAYGKLPAAERDALKAIAAGKP